MSLQEIKLVINEINCPGKDAESTLTVTVLICDDCLVNLTTGLLLVEDIQQEVKKKIEEVLSIKTSKTGSSPSDFKKARLQKHLCAGKPLYASCNRIDKNNTRIYTSYSNLCNHSHDLDDLL